MYFVFMVGKFSDRIRINVFCLLFQAQRDYFGAHTYERIDQPWHFVHTNWTGHGGRVASSTYKA